MEDVNPRTEMPRKPNTDLPDGLEALASLEDFGEFGSVPVNDKDGITLPAAVRRQFGLDGSKHYYLFGSPALGFLIVTGQSPGPREHFAFRVRRNGQAG